MADTYTLADLMEEQRTLGGPPALPDVRPREMRQPALGQSNLVDRALSSFGQPSLDALRRGYAGEATAPEIARTFLETGPIGPFGAVRTPPRVPNPIRAYHGSPHEFDEFRLENIGSGEGAQAYGHGLYFAENEGVARWYRDTLGRPVQQAPYRLADRFALGPPPASDPVGRRAYSLLQGRDGDLDAAIDAATRGSFFPDREAVLGRLNHWREQGLKPRPPDSGRMYEVNLHARPEQFLDWDAPLSGQSAEVREALAPLYERAMRRVGPLDARTHSNLSDPSGSTVVTALRNWEGAAPADISRILREAGIPGTVYDAGQIAGWQGPQSRNYSVFSPEIIEILRKYGIIAPPVGAAAASTLAGEPQP